MINELSNVEFAKLLNIVCSTLELKRATHIHLNQINHWFQTGELISNYSENYFWTEDQIAGLTSRNMGTKQNPRLVPNEALSVFYQQVYNSAVRRYKNANTEHHQEVHTYMAAVSIPQW